MTARPASGLSATVIPSDSGLINGIYVLHVGPDGDLKEITWDRAKNYTSYFIGELDNLVVFVLLTKPHPWPLLSPAGTLRRNGNFPLRDTPAICF